MKYVLSADWHIRASAPRIRKDDYTETQFNKVEWILNLAEDHDADVIVAGDIFDSPRCPFWLLNKYMTLFGNFKGTIYAIPGQHDLHFHNPDLENTPLGALINAGVVHIPNNNNIWGVGWGEGIPETWSEILVMHTPVTPDKPPFFMEDAISADEAINKWGHLADLIVTGDYHVPHLTLSADTALCNPGPIMRASKDKMGFEPRVYLYDEGEITTIKIPIKEDVFDEKALRDDDFKEQSDALKELIQSFDGDRNTGMDFWEILDKVALSMGVSVGAKRILDLAKEENRG